LPAFSATLAVPAPAAAGNVSVEVDPYEPLPSLPQALARARHTSPQSGSRQLPSFVRPDDRVLPLPQATCIDRFIAIGN
jgi:hypothetical protein